MKAFILFVLLLPLTVFVNSQNITGIWKTVDDNSGIDKSLVEIDIKNNKLYGHVVKILDESEGKNPVCTNCEGSKKNQPIIGMQVITGLSRDGSDWTGRNGLFDPETGNYYRGRIWLEDNNTLKVRGYISFFYRTQTWTRIE